MPIGKARERRRGRKAKDAERDPGSTEAYEHGWYALLVRQAAGEDDLAQAGAGENAETVEDVAEVGVEEDPPPEPEPPLATVTKLVVPVAIPTRPTSRARTPPPEKAEPEKAEPRPPSVERSGTAEPASMRIGVRRLEDPQSVYLSYLTASPHRHFFRAQWWPSSRSITPVHLWRANHLGAGWDLAAVDRFMDEAAKAADALVASAPHAERPGSPERRAWIGRLLSAEWVREFGAGRVSKALLPLLPELVPDLDPAVTPWATRTWLGFERSEETEEPERCLETWELLEDVLVLRGRQLAQVVGRLRRLAPGLAPIGRLGLVSAAFWNGYWAEPRPPVRRRGTPAGTASSRAGSRRSTSGAEPPKKRAPTREPRSQGRSRATPSASRAKARTPRTPRSKTT